MHDETGEFGAGQHYLGQWRHRAFSDSRISVDNIEVRVITDEAVKKYVERWWMSSTLKICTLYMAFPKPLRADTVEQCLICYAPSSFRLCTVSRKQERLHDLTCPFLF